MLRWTSCLALILVCGFPGAVWAANNPVPHIDNPLKPTSTASGGPAFALTVYGAGFVSSSVVNWNGSARQTTFINAGKLSAGIPASDIAVAGTASITVTNPNPGGGASNVVFFVVSGTPSDLQFTALTQDSRPFTPGPVTSGDFNGDGKLDVAYEA